MNIKASSVGLAPLLRLTSNNKKILLKRRIRSDEAKESLQTNSSSVPLSLQSSNTVNSSSQESDNLPKKPKLVIERPYQSLDTRLKSGGLKKMTLKKTTSSIL